MTQIDTLTAQVASSRVLSPDAKVFIPQQCKSAAPGAVLVPKEAPMMSQSFETMPDGSVKHGSGGGGGRMAASFPALGMQAVAPPVLTNGDVTNWHVANPMADKSYYAVKGSRGGDGGGGGKLAKCHRPMPKQPMDEYLYMPSGVPLAPPGAAGPAPPQQPPHMLYNQLGGYTPTPPTSGYVYIPYPPPPHPPNASNPAYSYAPPPPPSPSFPPLTCPANTAAAAAAAGTHSSRGHAPPVPGGPHHHHAATTTTAAATNPYLDPASSSAAAVVLGVPHPAYSKKKKNTTAATTPTPPTAAAAIAATYSPNLQSYEEWPEMMMTAKSPQPSKKALNGNPKEKPKAGSKAHYKNEASPRNIKLVETAVQTEFSSDLENLTLCERPSPLFCSSNNNSSSNINISNKNKKLRSRSNQWVSSLTDSEEKDSDSGYSSPLHRRNVVSNGTHAAPERLRPTPKSSATAATPTPTTTTKARVPHPAPNATTKAHAPPTTTARLPPTTPIRAAAAASPGPPQSVAAQHQQQQPAPFSYAAIAQRPARPTVRTNYLPVEASTVERAVSDGGGGGNSLDPKPGEDCGGAGGAGGAGGGKKKQQKQNRRKKKERDLSKGSSLSSPGQTPRSGLSNSVSMDDIPGDDFFQPPVNREPAVAAVPRMKYCDILKNNTVIHESASKDVNNTDAMAAAAAAKKDGHLTRRWQKRQELANRAAEEELAEISLEQQMLIQRNIPKKKPASATPRSATPTSTATKTGKSVSLSNSGRLSAAPPEVVHHAVAPGKKSKQPIALDISAMIDALEKQFKEPQQKKEVFKEKPAPKQIVGNMLDSSAPVKRGKEREIPKTKKPSPLKKVILKEREEKKRLRLLEVDPAVSSMDTDLESSSVPVGLGVVNAESDLSQDAASVKGDHGGTTTPASADLSPVSQTSPISISPLSSGVNSPIAGGTEKDVNPAVLKIHSRRFREYCNQILDKDIDACCTMLLWDLVSFQDRLYHKDPIKAKMRRRIVLGLREVTKHLKLKKLKCVIISPNLEKIQSKGGLDDALNNILNLCTDQDVPFVFALGRRALGRACAKLVPVSVVGIFNYEGSEENFRKLMDLTEKARQSYVEMVAKIEKDIQENVPQIYSNPTQIFAHMGHSRTPSGCSGISFASSILSEPISENYPQHEPETDSRGNEIAKKEKDSEMKISPLCFHQITASSMAEIDDGNEADTEDSNDTTCTRASTGNLESLSSAFEQCDSENGDEGLNINSLQNVLPHIDSIHSVGYELSTEILSQHSVRTIGDTSEVLSTHSSKTIGEGSSTIVTETYSEHGHLDKPTAGCSDTSINLTRVNAVEKDKLIQDWVKASQCCLEEDEDEDDDNDDHNGDDSSDQETTKEDGCESSGSSRDSTIMSALPSSPTAPVPKLGSTVSLVTVSLTSSGTMTKTTTAAAATKSNASIPTKTVSNDAKKQSPLPASDVKTLQPSL
ncbi:Hypothetical predicted protein [Argonauta hians]